MDKDELERFLTDRYDVREGDVLVARIFDRMDAERAQVIAAELAAYDAQRSQIDDDNRVYHEFEAMYPDARLYGVPELKREVLRLRALLADAEEAIAVYECEEPLTDEEIDSMFEECDQYGRVLNE
jgi:hypothetical protein